MLQQRIPTYLLRVNAIFELALPWLAFWYFGYTSLSWAHKIIPGEALGYVAAVLALVAYIIYVPVVLKVNIRTFPRTAAKAIQAVAVPLVSLVLLGVLMPGDRGEWFMIAGTQFYSAVLLATIGQITYRKEFRPFEMSRFAVGVYACAGIGSVIFFQLAAIPVFLGEEVGWMRAALWLIWVGVLIQHIVLHTWRSGMKRHAQPGYRPNAAVIVTNNQKQVLLCERIGWPGVVQTVQGGIDPGETPEEAARRELQEELGIWPEDYELLGRMEKTYQYEWDTNDKARKSGYNGQEQHYFLVRVKEGVQFDLDFHHREFTHVRWGDPIDLVNHSWAPKQSGLRAALRHFKLLK